MTDILEAPQQFYYTESGYRVITTLPRSDSELLVDRVLAASIEFSPLYKDTSKCLVGRFQHPDLGHLILKIPRARSHRRWERFLTLFRSGEGPRQFINMQKLLELGLKGPEPILAAEKRRKGVVVDSFYVYSFIEGREGRREDLELIVETLLPLYERGYCRADPQVKNHIIHNGDVCLIDFRITKPVIFGRVRCAMEFCQLVLSKEWAVELGIRAGYSRPLVLMAWIAQRSSQRLRKGKQKVRKAIRGF